ncbi:MAG: type II toxin-antitoxin system RelE/ParE family toxin [Ectothiorhodospiraceae bacterium]|nr:type II toxin-antitoxin system RelE/ParE family toxin [Ectothiorhodospiraceae bacterium]
MARVTWTREADRWLRDIFDYISLEDPIAANNVVEGIYQKSQILEEFPQIGYQYEHQSKRNVRILLYGHYRIAYEIADTQELFILGVFHGSIKIENYLF